MSRATVDKLTKARACLVLDHCFFGALALRLRLVEAPGIGTAATDGESIFYESDWIDTLSHAETMGLLAHEVLHVANGHVWRRDARESEQWNIACDAAINHILRDAGLTLPAGGIEDASLAGLSAEEAYPRCKRGGGGKGNKPGGGGAAAGGQPGGAGVGKPGGPPAPDPGKMGGVIDGPAKSPAEKAAAEAAAKVAVAQAAAVARAMGDLPASLRGMVGDIVNPRIPWRVVLADFVQRVSRNDYDWTRANRRHLQRGFILPTLHSNELGDVVVAVDTSGSAFDPDTLARFKSELSGVLAAFDVTAHVVFCDTSLHVGGVYGRADLPLSLDFPGGGGTDFRPPFEWVDAEGLEPACLIYLTDLFCSRFPPEPDYPVLWAVVDNPDSEAPFGVTLHID